MRGFQLSPCTTNRAPSAFAVVTKAMISSRIWPMAMSTAL
jgi:hypothetical protein